MSVPSSETGSVPSRERVGGAPEAGSEGGRTRDGGTSDGRTWAVLGGGGLKGLGHIGAWKAMEEHGITPDGILGTSIGALVGACLAGGMTPDAMREVALELERGDILRINRRAAWVNGIRAVSVFRGEVLREYIESVLPVPHWDQLGIPLQVNAVNLADGETEWFGIGSRTDVPLAEAVYASTALPVMYPPAEIDGGFYVDGGTVHALALERARQLGAARVVAVDVGSGAEDDVSDILDQGMIAVHQRVFSIMSGRMRRQEIRGWEGGELIFVRPELEGYSTFAFEHVEYFLDEGYRAARAVLENRAGAQP